MKSIPRAVYGKRCSQWNFIWLGNFRNLRMAGKFGNIFLSKTSSIIGLALCFNVKVTYIIVFAVDRHFSVKTIWILSNIRHTKELFRLVPSLQQARNSSVGFEIMNSFLSEKIQKWFLSTKRHVLDYNLSYYAVFPKMCALQIHT